MKIIALVLVAIFVAASISVSVGMTNLDKDAINTTMAQALEKTGDFSSIKAGVDSNNNLTIWANPKSTDQNGIIISLGYIVGAYFGAVKSYSDLSDLNVIIGINDSVAEDMYCKRSWVDEVKVDSAGNTSDSDIAALAIKVLGTLQVKPK